ncbi:MAG: molybdopterin-binding protein [Bryobacteraceae bacterium]
MKSSNGRVLCCTVFRPGGKKLLAKGHVISDDDIRVLESEGMESIWVTQLEEGEVGEDDAVCAVASEMGCGSFEIRLAAGGRANLQATEKCCVLVDDDLLRQINCAASVVIATALNFSFATPGQRIATVKSAPFAVSRAQLDAVVNVLKERGPILQARPIRNPGVAILYTDPLNGDRARQLFENIMHQRLEHFGVSVTAAHSCTEDEAAVGAGLQHLLRSKPAVVLIASTTAPAGPEDVVGRAMEKIGGHMERFLAPVEPGNLLLLTYKDDTPMISAPGCFRSAKANVVDLVLPPLLARYRVSGWEVGCLGHGGLLG